MSVKEGGVELFSRWGIIGGGGVRIIGGWCGGLWSRRRK